MAQERVAPSMRIPLLVDAGLLITIIFQAGVLWSKVDGLTVTVGEIQQQQQSGSLPAPAVDKLARIETKLDRVIVDVAELRRETHR